MSKATIHSERCKLFAKATPWSQVHIHPHGKRLIEGRLVVALFTSDGAKSRPSSAKHLSQVTNKVLWLLMSREMPAAVVFRLEYDVAHRAYPSTWAVRNKSGTMVSGTQLNTHTFGG